MLIHIPEELYNELQEIASTTAQAVEEMVIHRLKGMVDDPFAALPRDEQAELIALRYLSDDALWTIAAEQMPEDAQKRAHELLARSDKLTPEESAELRNLIERSDRLMVRKAEAATILRERGHDFKQKDFRP